jgi:hypothetical protein
MFEQKRFGQIRKNRVTVSEPHMNTETRRNPSASNVKQMTGKFTQQDMSFVISCEGHLPTTRKCHYYNPSLSWVTPYWHSTHHTMSLPHRNPRIADWHTINLRGRPWPVWHCGFTRVVPRSTPTVWTQRLLPSSEGCTYSLHPFGIPPQAIFSLHSNHTVPLCTLDTIQSTRWWDLNI